MGQLTLTMQKEKEVESNIPQNIQNLDGEDSDEEVFLENKNIPTDFQEVKTALPKYSLAKLQENSIKKILSFKGFIHTGAIIIIPNNIRKSVEEIKKLNDINPFKNETGYGEIKADKEGNLIQEFTSTEQESESQFRNRLTETAVLWNRILFGDAEEVKNSSVTYEKKEEKYEDDSRTMCLISIF